MYTKIIGHGVEEHSRSPLIWNHLYDRLGIDCQMRRKNLEEKQLFNELSEFVQSSEYRAILFAAPLKEAAVKTLRELGHDICGDLESVNLLYRINDKIHATSTDGFGAIASLGLSNSNTSFMILGHGGTSKSIINAIRKSNFTSTIRVATRQGTTNSQKASSIKFIGYEEVPSHLSETDIIINATILGNTDHLGYSPIGEEIFAKIPTATKLFDVNYNQTQTTRFLELGKKFGLVGIDGKPMNLMQALYAFKLCNNIEETLEDLVQLGEWQNV